MQKRARVKTLKKNISGVAKRAKAAERRKPGKFITAERELLDAARYLESNGAAALGRVVKQAVIVMGTQCRFQGIACALGELAGAHMEPDYAGMVLRSLGLTVQDLQRAGADPYDLKPLLPHRPRMTQRA